MLMVKAMRAPLSTPGRISGRITLRKAYHPVAPRSWAASKMLGSSCRSLGMTDRIT